MVLKTRRLVRTLIKKPLGGKMHNKKGVMVTPFLLLKQSYNVISFEIISSIVLLV